MGVCGGPERGGMGYSKPLGRNNEDGVTTRAEA
jgi:hypothetical protein